MVKARRRHWKLEEWAEQGKQGMVKSSGSDAMSGAGEAGDMVE